MTNNILNCPDGIKLWNGGQYNSLHAGAILKRLEAKSASSASIMLSNRQIERLKADDEFQKEHFNNKYASA